MTIWSYAARALVNNGPLDGSPRFTSTSLAFAGRYRALHEQSTSSRPLEDAVVTRCSILTSKGARLQSEFFPGHTESWRSKIAATSGFLCCGMAIRLDQKTQGHVRLTFKMTTPISGGSQE